MARISGITTDYPWDATSPNGSFLNRSRASHRRLRDGALVSPPKNLSVCDVLSSHHLLASGISMLARLSPPDGLAIIGNTDNDRLVRGFRTILSPHFDALSIEPSTALLVGSHRL